MYYAEKLKQLYKNYDINLCGNLCTIYNITAFGALIVASLVGRSGAKPFKRRFYTGLIGVSFAGMGYEFTKIIKETF